jgi:predicted PurR-regulated permease PerM
MRKESRMSAGQLAALIAVGFFAVLACVGVYVLVRLARLMTAVTGIVDRYSERADLLIDQAQAAIDRTNEQLIRTDAITASMDQVTANMAELSGHVSAMAGLARSISSAVSAPLTGLSAFAFGVRRAMLVRRSLQVAATESGSELSARPAIEATVTAVARRPDRPAGARPDRPAGARRGRAGRG